MIILSERRFLFIHVQKTGGTSVLRHVQEHHGQDVEVNDLLGGRHARLRHVLAAYPEAGDYFIAGFVRNPWARLYSWFSMVERRVATAALPGKDVLAARVDRNEFWTGVARDFPDFRSFVMDGTKRFSRIARPQLHYLEHRGRRADFIGRTETFQADFDHLCERVGLPTPAATPHRNAGPGESYREHYDEEMVARVAHLFAPDIDTFGYTF